MSSTRKYAHLPYRPCVGMLVLNQHDQAFVAKRIDAKEDAWQMPQGGIDEDEIPREAALRELKEEIGTNNVDIIAETHEWLHYELPDILIPTLWDGQYQGQKQKWFLMRFHGEDSDIDINTDHPEFNDWRWTDPAQLPDLAISFKRHIYSTVLQEFGLLT